MVWKSNFHTEPPADVSTVKIDTENQIRHKLKTAYVGQTKSGKPMYRLWDGHFYTVVRSPSVDTSILADSRLGGPGWKLVESSDVPRGHMKAYLMGLRAVSPSRS